MDVKSVGQDHAKPEDEAKPLEPIPTRRGVGIWSLWFFMVPVIYVLSIGPVAKIDQALHIPQKAPSIEQVLEAVYSPIFWCAIRSRPFENALNWYLFRLWKL